MPAVNSTHPNRLRPLVPRVVVLGFTLVCCVWLAAYFSPEARIRRATLRLVQLVEKNGVESELALGLSANRLGASLAADAELDWAGYGALASGRTEIVQLYATVRKMLETIAVTDPQIATVKIRAGGIHAFVVAHYRVVGAGEERSGEAKVELHWRKGDSGWQIEFAGMTLEGLDLPGGLK